MISTIKKISFAIAISAASLAFAQKSMAHSHNDYEQKVPFWYALGAGASSIEADVYLVNNELFVAHEQKNIQKERTFDNLYLKSIEKALDLGIIKDQPIQILIDLKTEGESTLKKVVSEISKYSKIVAQKNISFVISGNKPSPEKFTSYPDFIQFDYQSLDNLTPEQWKKVGLVSLNFKTYSVWNGKGGLTEDDLPKVNEVIKKAKSFNKPFRFWAIPDGKTSWEFFAHAGVDFINTDHPKECAEYIAKLDARTFKNTLYSEVYLPKFLYENKNIPVKNVILMIGDGNGLSQISSSVLANKGQLTLTQLKNIGLIKTTATDNFTTDSVHFQDLYGEFSDSDFKGIENPKTGKKTILRTMDSQLHSTRIFNENYFAFLAALDDIAKRNIKIVALPGDYTDDGQAYNLRGFKKILDEYQKKYCIRFLITTGNHDPVGPFLKQGGKSDFMNENGDELTIISSKDLIKNKNSETIVTKDIAMSGYLEILNELKDFGFTPAEKDLFWQTPFGKDLYQNYSFKNAQKDAEYSQRMYEVSNGFSVPDFSYVVEPVKGIWLLAIDGNTYIPKNLNGNPKDENNYKGASVGYNNVLTNKKHLFSWVKKISEEAEKHGKTVIAFTHYPVLDYNDGASEDIQNLLGKDEWQMDRVPKDEVAELFADAGLKLHFAGHMHINDTGIKKFEDGKMLVNIQVPSLAAYIPGYKILTVNSTNQFDVKTVAIEKVPRFDELFPLYEKEYEFLKNKNPKQIWNKEILKTKNYKDFTAFHLKELVRLRFVPSEWPKDFIKKAMKLNGEDLLNLSLGNQDKSEKINSKKFKKWMFDEVLLHLYQLQSADELARKDISEKRLSDYKILQDNFKKLQTHDKFLNQLKTFFSILEKLSSGEISGQFRIDFEKSEVIKI